MDQLVDNRVAIRGFRNLQDCVEHEVNIGTELDKIRLACQTRAIFTVEEGLERCSTDRPILFSMSYVFFAAATESRRSPDSFPPGGRKEFGPMPLLVSSSLLIGV